MTTYALDTESYYDGQMSLTTLGTARYVRETEHYLVSIVGDDGFEWVGRPQDAPWEKVSGAIWLSHNRSYDMQVIGELRRQGVVPADCFPAEWHCTADLSVYCQGPRSLKDAAAVFLDRKVNKTIRDNMKGRKWATLTEKERAEVRAYALDDARACLAIWQKLQAQWPQHERELSQHTSAMCERGIGIDRKRVDDVTEIVKTAVWRVGQAIPWFGQLDTKGKPIPITSSKMIAAECRKTGIPTPTTTEADSPEFMTWEQTYGEKAAFIKAIQRYRSVARVLSYLEAFQTRSLPGYLPYDLKYFGAPHTGRWAGGASAGQEKAQKGGLNLQNLVKEPLYLDKNMDVLDPDNPEDMQRVCHTIDVRGLLRARPGKKLIVADYSQIEARVALWLAGDEATLELLRQGMDLYETHARRTMGYSDPRPLKEVDNEMRQFAKCRCLAGDTLVLTNNGYIPIRKMTKSDRYLVWDGVEWVRYERVQCNGLAKTVPLNGEHFTDDHQIFVSDRETRSVGEIRQGRDQQPLLPWRPTPGSAWSDVWALARGIGSSLSQEWFSLCKSHLRIMRKRVRRSLGLVTERHIHTMRQMRKGCCETEAGCSSMGEGAR